MTPSAGAPGTNWATTGGYARGGRRPRLAVAGFALILAVLLLAAPTGPSPVGGFGEPAAVTAGAGPRTLALSSASVAATFLIKNGQSAATGSYDQPILVDPSRFAGVVDTNLSNVEFVTAGDTPIPSWVESLATPTTSVARIWLHLPSIASYSSVDVLMVAYPITSFVLSGNGPAGEAPELSGSYGQPGYAAWDDGRLVFPYYQNFSGTMLPGDWVASGGIRYTQSNGLHISGESEYDLGIYSTTEFPAFPLAVDFYAQLESTGGVTFAGLMANPTGPGACRGAGDCRDIIQSDSRTQSNAIEGEVGNSAAAIYTPFYSIGWNGNATWTIDSQPGATTFEENYSLPRAVNYTIGSSPLYLTAWSTGNVPHSTTVDGYFSWIRVRSPGPNDVLPSVTIVPSGGGSSGFGLSGLDLALVAGMVALGVVAAIGWMRPRPPKPPPGLTGPHPPP